MSVDISGVGSGPLSVGVVGAYPVWEPSVNFKYEWVISAIDTSDKIRVPRGATFIDKRPIFRRLAIAFPYIPEEEFWNFAYDAIVSRGQSEPLWVVPHTDPTLVSIVEKTSVYGLISQASEMSNPLYGQMSLPIQIDQL